MTTGNDTTTLVAALCMRAKEASRRMALASSAQRNDALLRIGTLLGERSDDIMKANAIDVEGAVAKGLGPAMIDRLTLTGARIKGMINGLSEVAALPDPVGEVLGAVVRPNGLQVNKVRVPLGVIGIVYESRPNVTVDAAALCLKSGNAVVLRGGSESINGNLILSSIVSEGLADAGLPHGALGFIPVTDRDAVTALARQKGVVDLIIARGSGQMIHALSEAATVPLVEHGGGICHVYIHEAADPAKAIPIAVNAKVSRPGVCNSAETFLVDESIASSVIPALVSELKAAGVEVRGCGTVGRYADCVPATDADWDTEYLDLIVSIKAVKDLDEAISHINRHSTRHSDSIVTESYPAARRFTAEVDSAAVYVNASTRFTDGNEFGLGAEIGISTQKLHARGPMGLNELTSTKYVVFGDGQIRR